MIATFSHCFWHLHLILKIIYPGFTMYHLSMNILNLNGHFKKICREPHLCYCSWDPTPKSQQSTSCTLSSSRSPSPSAPFPQPWHQQAPAAANPQAMSAWKPGMLPADLFSLLSLRPNPRVSPPAFLQSTRGSLSCLPAPRSWPPTPAATFC